MNNEEEIEIIDDTVSSSNAVESNNVDDNVSSEVNNQDVSSVFSGNPNEIDNSSVVTPNEEFVASNTIEEPSIFSNVPNESSNENQDINISDNVGAINNEVSSVEVNEEPVVVETPIGEPNNVEVSNFDNQEINISDNVGAINNEVSSVEVNEEPVVVETPIEEPNNVEVSNFDNQEINVSDNVEAINNEVSSVEVNEEPVVVETPIEEPNNVEVSNNNIQDINVNDNSESIDNVVQNLDNQDVQSIITPNEEVIPQEINNTIIDSIDDIQTTNNIVEEVPTPLVDSSNIVNVSDNNDIVSENNEEVVNNEVETNNGEITEIKTTAKIQNEVGTTVIGQINGDDVSVVGDTIPDSIELDAKTAAAKENKNKKEKIKTGGSKSTKIIIGLLLLVVIGAGGYYGYNYYINNINPSFEVKNITLNFGDEISSNVSDYISGSNIKQNEVVLDTSNVENTVGTYNYTVTYKGNVKTGTINIVDTKGPVVTFKDNLMFAKDSKITKENLVSNCSDPSNCTYELVGDIDSTMSGSQEVTINAKDDLGNTTEAKASISIIAKSLVCKSAETLSEDGTYNERLEDVFYFDDQDKYISSVGKKVTTFVDYGSFFTLIKEKEDNSEFNFDRKTFSYWVANDILYKDANTIDDIKSFYTTNKYTCD